MQADGNVMIGTNVDSRSALQSLKDLKKSIEQTFKGTSTAELETKIKNVGKDIKATEAEIRKTEKALNDLTSGEKDPQVLKQAQTRIKQTQNEISKLKAKLDQVMTGEKTPQSIKVLEKDLIATQREIDKVSKNFEKARLESEKYSASAGLNPRTSPNAQKYYDAQAALNRYSAEWEKLENHLYETQGKLDSLKQNPALTAEAQAYEAQIAKLEEKLQKWKTLAENVKHNPQATEEVQKYQAELDKATQQLEMLKEREREFGRTVEKTRAKQQIANNNFFTNTVAGLDKVHSRIVRLAKRVLFFSLITMGLRKLRKQIGALIKSDSQLSSSLAQVKGNLAAAFGDIWLSIIPALRALIHWLAIATKYIAAFISWITGKSLKDGQKAFQAASDASEDTAKNTNKIGKAAKKAAKEANKMLLPFDQMNILSKDKDSDTGDTKDADAAAAGTNIEYPQNLDKIIARFEKLKDLIVLIGIAFAAWKLAPLLSTLLGISKLSAFAGIASLAFGIYLLVTGIKDIIKNGPNFENVTRVIAGALLIVGGAALLLGAAWAPIVIGIGLVILALSKLYKHFKPFQKYVDKALKKIKKAFKDKGLLGGFLEIGKQIILGILNGMWWVIKKIGTWLKKKVFDPIVKGIKKLFGIESPAKETMPIGEMIIKGMLEGMLKPIKGIGKWIKNKIFTPIKKALFGGKEGKEGFAVKIGTKFTDTKTSITKKWNKLTSNVKDKTAEMKAEVKQKWNSIKKPWTELTKNAKDKMSDMKAKVPQKWANIQAGWTNLTKNVKDKTASMKAKVGSKWSDLKTTWNNLMANFKDKTASVKLKIGTTVSSAKDFVNDIIYKLNVKLANLKWPKWVPGIGGNYIFSTGNPIPYLAQGAVIPANKEFLAVLGDQKHGTNIETPLATMIDAFNTALQQNGIGGNGTPEINVYLQGDAKQLFKVVRTEANNYVQSTGKAAFNL